MYHIFFIHSSVGGHLGSFHVLAIVNSTAMNIRCIYLFELWFSLGICPGGVLLDYIIVLYFVLQGPSILFPIVAVPIYIPTNPPKGFPFLHTLSSICDL